MKVFVANVMTESCDHYTFVFAKEPTREAVIKKVWEDEGECESLEFYMDTTSVRISKVTVE